MTCSYAVLLTLLSAFSAFAQLGSTNPGQAPAAGQPGPTFRSDTNLVTVRFQMTPKKGQTADLRPEDIELREDGVPVKVSAFQGGQLYPPSIPVEVNLLFDDLRPPSGTTVPRWLQSQTLDLASIDDRGLVSVAVWAFNGDLVRLTPPTRDAATLNHAIEDLWRAWTKAKAPPYSRPERRCGPRPCGLGRQDQCVSDPGGYFLERRGLWIRAGP